MNEIKPRSSARGEPVRRRVLDAAEHLLRQGKAEFSMRDLAADAAVSFATPFNQFGSKAGVMHALSARRIDEMEARFRASQRRADARERVLLATDLACAVMLVEPQVSRAVMGWLGTAGPAPGIVWERSKALWALALGQGEGLDASRREQALAFLPRHLAFGFRGVLSFWTAGELSDADLAAEATATASALLLGYAHRDAC